MATTSRSRSSAAPASLPDDLLGRVVLVTGKEEFLNERVAQRAKAAVRQAAPDAEFSDTEGSGLTRGDLDELAAPSLFSATRCVVVRKMEDLPDDGQSAVLDYAAAPSPDVALVLMHSGGNKGSGVLTKLRKVAAVTEMKSEEVKASRLPDFVRGEVSAFGGRIAPEAADGLVQAVGHDLRSLSAAAHQLVSDFGQETISEDKVGKYFGGRAEAKSFAVADLAFSGRTAHALEELRWALDTGTPPVLVTSAFASSARAIAKYLGAPNSMREADLARELGVPPWKVRTVRDQSRAWGEAGIGAALRAVATADADIKGAAHDAPYTMERLVLTVTGLRTR